MAACFKTIDEDIDAFSDKFLIDDSDHICADYVITQLTSAPPNTLVVIDYLQLLDQRRENAILMNQVQRLKDFARQRHLIILCLSQIDRRYNPKERSFPESNDVRLPNPLDLSLFDRMCFLNQGKMQIT